MQSFSAWKRIKFCKLLSQFDSPRFGTVPRVYTGLVYHETVGGAIAVKRDNIITNIFYFSMLSFVVRV